MNTDVSVDSTLPRLEDVKLTISFQNLPAAKELSISSGKDTFQNLPAARELNLAEPGRELNLPGARELNISGAGHITLASPHQVLSFVYFDIVLTLSIHSNLKCQTTTMKKKQNLLPHVNFSTR